MQMHNPFKKAFIISNPGYSLIITNKRASDRWETITAVDVGVKLQCLTDGVGGISEGGDLLLISRCLLWLRQTKSKFSPGSSPATEHQVRQVASVVTADKERARWVTHDNPYLYFLLTNSTVLFSLVPSWIPRVLSFSPFLCRSYAPLYGAHWVQEPFPLMALAWPGSSLRLIQRTHAAN